MCISKSSKKYSHYSNFWEKRYFSVQSTETITQNFMNQNSNLFTPPNHQLTPSEEGVRLIWIIHLLANICSGGIAGVLVVFAYTIIKKGQLSELELSTATEIINFNISYIIYFAISGILLFLLIGFILLPIVWIVWFILMIIGTIAHFQGKNYIYPTIFRLVTKI